MADESHGYHENLNHRETRVRHEPETSPEQAIALAVLMQAIHDVKERSIRRDKAYAWLIEKPRMVEFWCDAAGVNVESFYQRLIQYLVSVETLRHVGGLQKAMREVA